MSTVTGKVAASIPQWASMIRKELGVLDADPDKDSKIWATDNASWRFSSGSDLDVRDYLLLRVLWTPQSNINSLAFSIRDNPDLKGGPYTGYVSPQNDELARKIYERVKDGFQGYLEDIVSNKDGTRPRPACGMYGPARYWQAMAVAKIKEDLSAREVAAFPKKVRKKGVSVADPPTTADSSAGSDDEDGSATRGLTASMATTSISGPPATPARRGPGLQPDLQSTPVVPRSYPNVGGSQNPASTDEYYVNAAILLFLQQLLYDMRQLFEESPGEFPGVDLDALDWLVDRLSLKLYSRQPGSDPLELMESRVDGFLGKRISKAGEKPAFSNFPLAIIEAKACVRSAGASPIRWQESAEVGCWVSWLPDEWEHYGLLHPSTSGRKRRLLISQNRDEIYIIVAEYGDAWKQYIRAGSSAAQPTGRTKSDARDLAGSDAYVRNAEAAPKFAKEFTKMVETAASYLPEDNKGPATRRTRAQKELKLLGPEHFCYMHQWGPFMTTSADDMDLFLRRMVALQVQLLSTATDPATDRR